MSRSRDVFRALALLLAIALLHGCKERSAPTTLPATAPATAATTQVAEKQPPRDYLDVVRVSYPRVASTQPLDTPLSLMDAGHFVVTTPLFMCSQEHLWLTHPEGKPIEEVLKSAT